MKKEAVKIEYQVSKRGHLAVLKLTTTGSILETCGHHHPDKQAAKSCAVGLARTRGYALAD